MPPSGHTRSRAARLKHWPSPSPPRAPHHPPPKSPELPPPRHHQLLSDLNLTRKPEASWKDRRPGSQRRHTDPPADGTPGAAQGQPGISHRLPPGHKPHSLSSLPLKRSVRPPAFSSQDTVDPKSQEGPMAGGGRGLLDTQQGAQMTHRTHQGAQSTELQGAAWIGLACAADSCPHLPKFLPSDPLCHRQTITV